MKALLAAIFGLLGFAGVRNNKNRETREEVITGAGVSEFPPAEALAREYHRTRTDLAPEVTQRAIVTPIRREFSPSRVDAILKKLREQMDKRTWRPRNRRPRHARY